VERGGVGAFIAKVKNKNAKQFEVSNHKLLQTSAPSKNCIRHKNRKNQTICNIERQQKD
jgi:hypothetical protein